MRIGIPREIKVLEGRVALIPAAAAELVQLGHEVLLESNAGRASGYTDEAYSVLGIRVLENASELYRQAELVVKVKEPQTEELDLLREDHLLFCYLHLAAEQTLMSALRKIGLTSVAFETVETDAGLLPLLAPMSDIAGRIAVQVGTHLLHAPMGGKGLLLGGLPAAERGKVVILGAGVAGGSAALLAAGLGANVTVFDRDRAKLERMRALGANVTALFAYHDSLVREVASADLLIGAVLVAGERAPHLVDLAMVKSMQEGSVVVDISVDQGGCIASTRPTTYADPTFVWEGVLHFCVTNMPGAVPRSASQALSAALIPYVKRLAMADWQQERELCRGINTQAGRVVHPALRKLLN